MERLPVMETIWCNGVWRRADDPIAVSSDRGLLHGLGLFETLLAVDGRVVHVDRHLKRLALGLERLGWLMPAQDLSHAMQQLLERNALCEGRARIRLAITGGSGSLQDLSTGGDRLCWMSASAVQPAIGALKIGISPWRRNEHSPLAGLKCASYAENLLALDWARQKGLDEVLLLNTANELCEAACANVFLVRDEMLMTPRIESGCLPGITRGLVLELASRLGFLVTEGQLTTEDVKHASECFLTSSTRGLMPVSSIGGVEFVEGAVTRQLTAAWEDSLNAC